MLDIIFGCWHNDTYMCQLHSYDTVFLIFFFQNYFLSFKKYLKWWHPPYHLNVNNKLSCQRMIFVFYLCGFLPLSVPPSRTLASSLSSIPSTSSLSSFTPSTSSSLLVSSLNSSSPNSSSLKHVSPNCSSLNSFSLTYSSFNCSYLTSSSLTSSSLLPLHLDQQ